MGGWVGVLWLGCVGRGAACELSSSSPLLACTVCTPRTRHTSCLLASQLPLPPFPTCWQALDEVLPAVKAELAELGGFWVLRPDSGAPCWWRQWGVAGGASLLCPPQPCKCSTATGASIDAAAVLHRPAPIACCAPNLLPCAVCRCCLLLLCALQETPRMRCWQGWSLPRLPLGQTSMRRVSRCRAGWASSRCAGQAASCQPGGGAIPPHVF